VIFRQGDPASACYVVVEGKVGVFVRDPSTPPTPREVEVVSAKDLANPDMMSQQNRFRKTYEGFSTFSKASNFGNHIHTMESGRLFGELALLSQATRSATIKCLEDCELLSVSKADFDSVLRGDVLAELHDKMVFLRKTLPGMDKVPRNVRVHPSYMFQLRTFPAGHHLLSEGKVEDRVAFVVKQGMAIYTRTAWAACSPGAEQRQAVSVTSGDFFCSASAFAAMDMKEPVSVIVTPPSAQVLVLDMGDLKHLPEEFQVTFMRHLRSVMMARIKKLCIQVHGGRSPAQSPRATDPFHDFRDAPKCSTVERRDRARGPREKLAPLRPRTK